ncbi:uncharacterized protein LOC111133566 isoform X2 [Crassostrea virginica]
MAASNERRFSLADFIKSERVKRNENEVEDIKSVSGSDFVKSSDDRSLRTVSRISTATSGNEEASALHPVRVRKDQTRQRRNSKFYDASRKSIAQDVVDQEVRGVSTAYNEEQSPSSAPRSYNKRRRFSVIQDNEGDSFTLEDKLKALQEEGGKPDKKNGPNGRSRRASKLMRALSPCPSSAGSGSLSMVRAEHQEAATSTHELESRQVPTKRRKSTDRKELENEADIESEDTVRVEIRRGKLKRMQSNVIVLQLGETAHEKRDKNVTVCRIGSPGPADSASSVSHEFSTNNSNTTDSRESVKPCVTPSSSQKSKRQHEKDPVRCVDPEAVEADQGNKDGSRTEEIAEEEMTRKEPKEDPTNPASNQTYRKDERENINLKQEKEQIILHGEERKVEDGPSTRESLICEPDSFEYKQEENDAANCTTEGENMTFDIAIQRTESNIVVNQLSLNSDDPEKADFQTADVGANDESHQKSELIPDVPEVLQTVTSETTTESKCECDKRGLLEDRSSTEENLIQNYGDNTSAKDSQKMLQLSSEDSKLETQNPETNGLMVHKTETETNTDNDNPLELKTQIVESKNEGERKTFPTTTTQKSKCQTEKENTPSSESCLADLSTIGMEKNEITLDFITDKSEFTHESAHKRSSVLNTELVKSNLDINKEDSSLVFKPEQLVSTGNTDSELLELEASHQPDSGGQGTTTTDPHVIHPPDVPDTPAYQPVMEHVDAPATSAKTSTDTRAYNARICKSQNEQRDPRDHNHSDTNDGTATNQSPVDADLQQSERPNEDKDDENSDVTHPVNSTVNNDNESHERSRTPAEERLPENSTVNNDNESHERSSTPDEERIPENSTVNNDNESHERSRTPAEKTLPANSTVNNDNESQERSRTSSEGEFNNQTEGSPVPKAEAVQHKEQRDQHVETSKSSDQISGSNVILDNITNPGSPRTMSVENFQSTQRKTANRDGNGNHSNHEYIKDDGIKPADIPSYSSPEAPVYTEAGENSGVGMSKMHPQEIQFGTRSPPGTSDKRRSSTASNSQRSSPTKRIEITIKDDDRNYENDLTLVIEMPKDERKTRATTPAKGLHVREQCSQTEELGRESPRSLVSLPPIKCEPPLVQSRERSFVRLQHTPAKVEPDPEVLYFIEQAELNRQRSRVEALMKELYQINRPDLLLPSPCPALQAGHVVTASRDRHPRFYYGDDNDIYENLVVKASGCDDGVRRFLGYTKRTDRLQIPEHSRKYKAYIDLRKKLKHLY